MIANLLKYLVFGTLSDAEVLVLSSKSSHTAWEFVTGFLVFYFSADFGHQVAWEALQYGGLFFCVLLVKFFGFLIADRVHNLYFSPSNHTADSVKSVRYGYLRLGLGIVIINFVNILLLYKFFHDVMWQRYMYNNVLGTIFGFEVLNHCPSTISTSFIYAFNCYETLVLLSLDSRAKRLWRRKKLGSIYALEFVLNLLRLIMTVVFYLFFLYHYTFPIHSMPSSYISLKKTVAKARALIDLLKRDIMVHKLQIPDEVVQRKCIVCYEDLELVPIKEIRCVVPCQHSFHDTCIKRWLRISPTCPICREKI